MSVTFTTTSTRTTGGPTPGSETLTELVLKSTASGSSSSISSSSASTTSGSLPASTRRGNATVSDSNVSTSSVTDATGVTSTRRPYLIGISVGVALVALIILGCCILYIRQRKRSRRAEEARKRMDTTMLRQAVGLPPVSVSAMGRTREDRRNSDAHWNRLQHGQGEHHDAASDLQQPPDYDLLTPSAAPLIQSRSTINTDYSNPFADPNPFADARSLARTTSSASSRTTLPGYTEYEHLNGILMHVDLPPLYEDIHALRRSDS